MSLLDLTCITASKALHPLPQKEVDKFLLEVPGWTITAGDVNKLSCLFKFPDFVTAMNFVNRVGTLAEAEQHHPDIYLGWGFAKVEVWTHTIKDLTINDFILAAKVNQLL